MPVDNKYGRVSLPDATFTKIDDDEPVVVFRAKDVLLPDVLNFYLAQCKSAGSPPTHLELIKDTLAKVLNWQQENYTKIPDSKGWANR